MDSVMTRLDAIERAIDAIERTVKQNFNVLVLQQEMMLTMSEAARLVGVCEDRFRRIHARLVPHYRVGKRLLFKKSELMLALDGFKRLDTATAAQNTLQQAGKAVRHD